MKPYNILIAGSGGIGKAAGLILACQQSFDCNIILGDRYDEAAQATAKFVNDNSESNDASGFVLPSEGMSDVFKNQLEKADIILDCLPGSQAPRLAQYAHDNNCHYANLTEYVKETDEVTKIAKNSNKGFILQTGLAPGYINVIAHHLFKKFTDIHQVEKVDNIDMKVGALSRHARHPHYYAFTWSPIGVATEYIKDALVVENYETSSIPSLSRTEGLIIEGIQYEDDFTSGGAADLPVALAGKVKNLNYKTIRFPGHYEWARKVIKETPAGQDQITHLNDVMINEIPSVQEDVVIVFVSVKGKDNKGVLRAMEKSIHVYPSKVGKHTLRAIQTTTAAPLCEAAVMLLSGQYQGPVFQSQINTKSFLNGQFVSKVYGGIE
jgi:saccharopine dehydrogenase-like NADP-dependent oxidoreductase